MTSPQAAEAPSTDSRYNEVLPSAAIARGVACIWQQTISGRPGAFHHHVVIPDGCMDLIAIGNNAPVIAGPDTAAVTAQLPANISLAGIRFKPGWLPKLLGISAEALKDQLVPLSDIIGARADRLADELAELSSNKEKISCLVRLTARQMANTQNADPLINAAIIKLALPQSQVNHLAEQFGLSERQIQRRFRAAIGYGPKTLQRIIRLQQFLKLLPQLKKRAYDLADAAAALGYADQAHMTREIKALTGYTPLTALQHDLGGALSLCDMAISTTPRLSALTTLPASTANSAQMPCKPTRRH